MNLIQIDSLSTPKLIVSRDSWHIARHRLLDMIDEDRLSFKWILLALNEGKENKNTNFKVYSHEQSSNWSTR